MQPENTKRIAVLIPAYNAENTIHKAIDSLNQNTEPHDIIVVDDGSRKILAQQIPAQPNLIILRMERNGGITRALNFGVKYIIQQGYEFIARLDADDVAVPERLAVQREFMDRHRDVALAGSWGKVVSEDNTTLFYLNHPTEHEDIMKKLYYNSQFLHPSLIIRTDILQKVGYYSEGYPSAEDYELVRRIATRARLANIGKYLIHYTSSTKGISQSRRQEQLVTRLKIQMAYKNVVSPHFYLGLLKTIALLVVPVDMINSIKMKKKEYKQKTVS